MPIMPDAHLRNVDLNLLHALHALLEERHVTRAAKRSFLSQPAMSRALDGQQTMVDRPLAQLGVKRHVALRLPFFLPAIFALAEAERSEAQHLRPRNKEPRNNKFSSRTAPSSAHSVTLS